MFVKIKIAREMASPYELALDVGRILDVEADYCTKDKLCHVHYLYDNQIKTITAAESINDVVARINDLCIATSQLHVQSLSSRRPAPLPQQQFGFAALKNG